LASAPARPPRFPVYWVEVTKTLLGFDPHVPPARHTYWQGTGAFH
jgi:hypothetical protein